MTRAFGVGVIVCTVACSGARLGSSPAAPTTVVITAPESSAATMTAMPIDGTAPLAVHVVADVPGVRPDDATFYCPTIRWEFGDTLGLEIDQTCLPYTPDRVLQTRYAVDHTFTRAGDFAVTFQLEEHVSGRPLYRDLTHVRVR